MKCPHLVVIVDDDESVRRSIRRIVRSHGFDSQAFGSCEAFLLSGLEPGCLILDYRLPGMHGGDLLTRLSGTGRKLPFILISGQSDMAYEAGDEQGHCIAVLRKPLEEEELMDAVRRALGVSQSHQSDNVCWNDQPPRRFPPTEETQEFDPGFQDIRGASSA